MSEDVVPCDELREPFYCRGRCICGVLSELHTPEGWAQFYEARAAECERAEASLRQQAERMVEGAARNRGVALAFPTPRKFDRPSAGLPQEPTDTRSRPTREEQRAHLDEGSCRCHDSWDQCPCAEGGHPTDGSCNCCPLGTGLCGPRPQEPTEGGDQ